MACPFTRNLKRKNRLARVAILCLLFNLAAGSENTVAQVGNSAGQLSAGKVDIGSSAITGVKRHVMDDCKYVLFHIKRCGLHLSWNEPGFNFSEARNGDFIIEPATTFNLLQDEYQNWWIR